MSDEVRNPILISMEEEYTCPNPACGRVHHDGGHTSISVEGKTLWAGCLVCWAAMMQDLPDRVALQKQVDRLNTELSKMLIEFNDDHDDWAKGWAAAIRRLRTQLAEVDATPAPPIGAATCPECLNRKRIPVYASGGYLLPGLPKPFKWAPCPTCQPQRKEGE